LNFIIHQLQRVNGVTLYPVGKHGIFVGTSSKFVDRIFYESLPRPEGKSDAPQTSADMVSITSACLPQSAAGGRENFEERQSNFATAKKG
jgi:hypothetical protein